MIEMISGVCGSPKGLMHPGSGAFSLAPDEEARLVRRGVAVYVQEIVEEANAPADESDDLEDAIGPIGFDELPETVEVEEVDLSTLSAKELREVGQEYGLTFKGNASKAEMIREIEAAQAAESAEIAEDGEPAPEFDAAEAVV